MIEPLWSFLAMSFVFGLMVILLKSRLHRVVLFLLWFWLVLITYPQPNERILPDEFILVAAVVQEPHGDYKGRIWLWARTKEDPLTPVSFDLPYDHEAAQVVRGWIKKIGGGKAELGVNLNATEASKQQERGPQPLKGPDERDT